MLSRLDRMGQVAMLGWCGLFLYYKFLYSNLHLRFVKLSIFSFAAFLRNIEYLFSLGTIRVSNLLFLFKCLMRQVKSPSHVTTTALSYLL